MVGLFIILLEQNVVLDAGGMREYICDIKG